MQDAELERLLFWLDPKNKPKNKEELLQRIKAEQKRENLKNELMSNYGNQRSNGNNYQNSRYNNNGNTGNNEQRYKRSGSIYSKITKGEREGGTIINAWRATKNGIQTAKAYPHEMDVVHTSKKGEEFTQYFVEVACADLGTSQTYLCLMHNKSQIIGIKELGLIISPNGSGVTRKGTRVKGYFGKTSKK
jgi:hypothetical protein